MAPRPWADLLPELLCRIGDRMDLKGYASARGVCTAWRCALVPPSPALLVVAADGARLCPYAASLPTRRSFELAAMVSRSRCVGSSNGWLALRIKCSFYQAVFVLVNPITAVEIVLPPLIIADNGTFSRPNWVSKVVFNPNPAKDDFAAAAICDVDKIAYVTAGARRWAIMGPVLTTRQSQVGDQLIDVVYTDKGEVYCLTKCGDVHVLRIPKRQRQCWKPANAADEAGPSSEPELLSALYQYQVQPPLKQPAAQGRHRCQVSLPRERDEKPCRTRALPSYRHKELVTSEWEGPNLNAPATVEPLLPLLDRATVFAPRYGSVSAFTGAKNLVFCEGNLYQVWRNVSCTVTLQLPAGCHRRRVEENEILVLRYYPGRQPCWDAVKDLGGYSLFVGRNNAVSMYAEGVPGLRGNCVYWIGGRGRDQGMVFDMESGRSTPCKAPQAGLLPGGHPHSTLCWYIMSDVI